MDKKKKYIIYSIILLLVVSLSVGFSAFQKQLLIDDSIFHVRLHEDVRVSDIKVQSSSENVVSNYEDFNVSKLYGSVNFPSNNSYILYKLDLTNYGNLKSGLFSVTNNESGTSVQLCDSSASNCTSNFKTPICNGNSCTLGSTKEIYVKVISNSSGNKMIDIDFDFEPYHTITYENFNENTSSLQTEIMEKDVYEVTLTSDIVEVGVSGGATASYNTSNHKLTISNVTSDVTVTAKYNLADFTNNLQPYQGADPDNYVLLGNELYRIVKIGNIDDGYGNTDLRAKITRDSSIGQYIFDENTDDFRGSSLDNTLNNTYYNSLTSTQKELIDTALWSNVVTSNLFAIYTCNIALIHSDDVDTILQEWLAKDQYIFKNNRVVFNNDNSVKNVINVKNDYSVRKLASSMYVNTIQSRQISNKPSDTLMNTYPTLYLSRETLVVGGSGTRSNPYILDKKSDGLQSNPTVVSGRTISVNGNNQDLVTVENRVGTVYYSTSTELNSSNYSSASTIIPKSNSVGVYPVYYYIPAGNGYKAKKGMVYSIINGRTYTIAYQIGSNVDSIGKNSDTCTTTGSSLTCNVNLPSITASSGYNYAGWHTSSGSGISLNVGDTYTLSADGVTLYANAISINYQNTTTLAYYNTLNEAFSDVANNQTIKVMTNTTETTKATLASSKTGIKLDLNGYSITVNGTYTLIENNGSLDITNSISQTSYLSFSSLSSNGGIINNGTLNLYGSNIESEIIFKYTDDSYSTDCYFIVNNNNSTLVTDILIYYQAGGLAAALNNYGTVTINGGMINTVNSILNQSTGTITINSAFISAVDINNKGILNINDSKTTFTDVRTISSGTLNISDGTFSCTSSGCNILQLTGTTLITGGSFSSYGTTMTLSSGSLTILDGEIKQLSDTNKYAISATSGTLTIGKNDSTVSTTSPKIESQLNSAINISSSATYNFYDGVIIGKNTSMSRNPDNIPTGYEVVTDVTSTKSTSYLARRLHATIYYNSNTTSGNLTVSSEDVSCDLEGSATSCTIEVPSTITNSVGKYNSAYKGVSSSLSSMNTSSLTINANTTFYAIYSSPVTRYYYSSGYKTNTIYRNEYLISLTEMNSVLNTLEDGSSNYTTSRGPGSSNFLGLSTAQDTTPEYNTVGSAANSDSMTLYTVYQFVLNFQAGANVSAIGSSSSTCNVTTSDTSCSVTLPTITPNVNYISVGWSLSNGDTTGTPELSLYTLTNNNRVLYANAVAANYINTTTNEGYTTLNDAFTNVSNNQTIKVLSDTTETTDIDLDSSKTGIKLDLNGHSINITTGHFESQGQLDIYNTSSNTGIINGSDLAIENNGILTINGTSTTNKVIINGEDLGIFNADTSGVLTINNNVEINATSQNPTESGDALANNGIINIVGGSVTGVRFGVYNFYDGRLYVTGGTVTGNCALYGNGTTTVGTNDSTVNTNSPVIRGVGSSQTSGVFNYYGTFNFYDGIITSEGGTGSSIISEINEGEDEVAGIPADYYIYKETINGVENAYLKKYPLLMQSSSGAAPTNYLRTNIAKQNIENVTFVNSISGHTVNETDCFDVSRDEDGSVLAWVSDSDSNGKYEITIGAEGNVYASSGYYLFANLSYLNSLNGLQYLDTSKVTSMNYMFYYTGYNSTSFTLDLGNNFDTSNVTTMNYMFYYTGYTNTSFTLNLGNNFDTSKVTSMTSMFYYTGYSSTVFTFDLKDKFNTSNVRNMNYMFSYAGHSNTSFTLDLGDNFDTSQVTTMAYMFHETGLNSRVFTLDLGDKFDTSNVTTMSNMFRGIGYHNAHFTLDLGDKFYTSKVTSMANMFRGMSYGGGAFELDLGDHFDISSLTNTAYMFYNCRFLKTIYVPSDLDVTNITESTNMFYGCTSLVGMMGTAYNESNPKDKTYAHLDGGTSNPGYFTKIGGTLALGNNGSTTFFNSSPINKSDVETIAFQKTLGAPSGSLGSWDASLNLDNSVIAYYTDTDSNGKYEVTIASDGIIFAPQDSSYLFAKFANLTSFINLTYLNTSNVTNMSSMFASCKSLTTLDLSSFDTSKVTNMAGMFQIYTDFLGRFTSNLVTITGLNKFNTSNVTDMSWMFKGLIDLTSIDVSSFDTSKVTNMSSMFSNCTSLTVIDVSNFNTSNVTDMSWMFSGDKYIYGSPENYIMSLNSIVGIENFDTSNVTNLQGMFGCTNLGSLNLSSWDTSKVTNMNTMFRGSNLLNTVSVSNDFVTTNVTDSIHMFLDCTSLVGGSGTVYDSSHVDVTYAHIDEGTSNPGYFTSSPASQNGGSNNISNSIMNGVDSLLNSINKGN